MWFLICFLLVIIIFLIIKITIKFEKIKTFVRFLSLSRKLPTLKTAPFFRTLFALANCSPEKTFTCFREWLKESPVFIIYSPVNFFVIATGPEEVEACIGGMKNLTKSIIYNFLHNWLGKGLLTSDAALWKQRRKILTPAFHFSILTQFIDIFNKEAEVFAKEITENYLNQEINVTPLVSTFSLATMSETSMGVNLDFHTNQGVAYKKTINELEKNLYTRFVNFLLWSGSIYKFTYQRLSELKNVKILHNFTNNIIQKRSENFKTFDERFDENIASPTDDGIYCSKRKFPLLDILLNAKFKANSIDDTGIRNEVDTFMFEGHDTTSTCLTFTIMLLACHKKIQQQVYEEIIGIIGKDLENKPTYADLQKMDLLERCIKESLRLYPPVPFIGRQSSEEIPTKYGIIPKGVELHIHVLDMHRNPLIWPDPEIFDPSRHLTGNSRGRHPYAFIPFSAGPRNCIGQKFAMLEIKAFFCEVLRRFKLEPVDTPKTIVLSQLIVLRVSEGVKAKYVLRE